MTWSHSARFCSQVSTSAQSESSSNRYEEGGRDGAPRFSHRPLIVALELNANAKSHALCSHHSGLVCTCGGGGASTRKACGVDRRVRRRTGGSERAWTCLPRGQRSQEDIRDTLSAGLSARFCEPCAHCEGRRRDARVLGLPVRVRGRAECGPLRYARAWLVSRVLHIYLRRRADQTEGDGIRYCPGCGTLGSLRNLV